MQNMCKVEFSSESSQLPSFVSHPLSHRSIPSSQLVHILFSLSLSTKELQKAFKLMSGIKLKCKKVW